MRRSDYSRSSLFIEYLVNLYPKSLRDNPRRLAAAARTHQALTAKKMQECIWVRSYLAAISVFLEWTDSNHVRHIKFVFLDQTGIQGP
jgi:hypothetical protein